MGIIKAIGSAIGGGLADQWLEVIEPDNMGGTTVFTGGVPVRKDDKRNQNKKGTEGTVSEGSIIHVYPNQFMLLLEGGKVVDYTAEEGYYEVKNNGLPSLFNGQFKDTLKETFSRIKYAGVTPRAQKVFYLNLQEIKGLRFGTKNPVNYFDNFYNAELFLRAHGNYSIKITEPLRFFMEVIPRNADRVDINDINEQYLSEFLDAFQAAINQLSADGERISHVTSKSRELSRKMADILDEEWKQMRGMEIQSVGIASISYDDESTKLINMRNQGAMLSDPSLREGYVQGSVARGVEAAGSNASGSMAGFMGVGVGMQAGGSFLAGASGANQSQMEREAAKNREAESWKCGCGQVNSGKFCSACGAARPQGVACEKCGHTLEAGAKFCPDCGAARPVKLQCNNCGKDLPSPAPKFCPHCGDAVTDADVVR